MIKHLSKFIILSLCLFAFSESAFAQKKTKIRKSRAEFDSNKIVQVKYGSALWNKDAEAINSGVVVLRDGKTNKTMQVLLEETAPDSGVFSGTYSISWGGDESIKPEVYVLNAQELVGEKELKKVLEDIASGKLKRKPLFYKKNEVGVQTLEVFENKEQAQQALNLIKFQNQKIPSIDLSSVTSKDYAAAKAVMDSQELAKFAEENEARRSEVQKRLVDRFRLEQTEKLRIEKAKKEQQAIAESEKKKRMDEAEQFAESALDFYRAQQYEQAEENFRKSFMLNPNSTQYYFQYGMSLYKNEKYNAAVIVFNIAKENKEFEKESIYYTGLSQYAMKEYETAFATFAELKKTKDEKLAPLASFYSGMIYYDQKAYEKAKPEFEEVLDTSKDPKLDQRAENYIDNINQVLQYAKIKERKVFLSASLGAIYDSNVLQQGDSSSDQGGETEEKSLRYILGLGAYYRPIFTKAYEFGVKARTDYIYTQNNDATDYDPWSIQLNAPYAYKTALFGKSYKLDVKPGYELLYLGQEADSGDPKKTLKGYYLDVGNTFVMQDNWFTTFTLSFRKDDFFEDADQGKNANKLTFKWSNMVFINEGKNKGILAELGHTKSDADDSVNSTKRFDLSAMYIAPVFKDKATFAGGLSTYLLDYDDPNKENDFNKTLNLTLTRQFKPWLSGTVLGTYVLNDSDTPSQDYNKWTLGFVFNAEVGF